MTFSSNWWLNWLTFNYLFWLWLLAGRLQFQCYRGSPRQWNSCCLCFVVLVVSCVVFSGLIVALLTGTTQWDKLFPSQFSYLAGGFQGTLQETFFVSLLTLNVCDVNTYNALVAVLLIDVFQTLSLALGHKVRLCNPVTKVDCSTSLVKASCNHYNKKSFLIDGHFILGIKKFKPYGAASVQNQEAIVNILQGM